MSNREPNRRHRLMAIDDFGWIGGRGQLTEARVVLEDWRWKYNNIRPHRSLGYITPIRFAQKEQEPKPAQCQASLRPGIDFLYNLKHTINTPRLTLALALFG